MSNALALAAVSAVLKDLLNNGLIDHDVSTAVGSPVTVSILPPDRVKTGDEEQPQLNLFLYQVAQNSSWQNVGLPSRDDQGARLTNPPLALDLRYLLTAYGKNDFDGEILLGYAMQLLHENPVLPRDAIRTALGSSPPGVGGPPVTGGILPIGPFSASDLADQVEQIKITPQNLNTEELSKLWTALQAHYRPTAAYHVSVVLIESSKRTKSAKLVSKRSIFVLPFRRPVINDVSPQIVLPGAPLTLSGHNLKADVTKANFGTSMVDPTAATDVSLQAVPPGDLLPGVNTVQVVQPLDFGTPVEPHRGFESNVAAFILAPKITTPQPLTVAAGGKLTLGITPPVGRAQRVSLLLGDLSISIPPRSATGPATTATFDFPIPADVPHQTYPVRIQVDGAQSPLDIDTDPKSPTFNQYTGGPKVTVT
jgi:hypothetical protein